MSGGNPRSARFMAACVRHVMLHEKDSTRREALQNAADFLERTAAAKPAIKRIMEIYAEWPDAILEDVRPK